ncbi:hypothetical protein [Halorubrum cibi]|uniref:Uncharacterized protein n=1 Tax=Halorubrum cibi TaxID=413815 RepID=A0A521B698_9EURY|nr:hypothetical protein [Halorubrum cibi]SMO42541.1 hypothetical protein SAMN06264867_10238 [Halorubrum cibi]
MRAHLLLAAGILGLIEAVAPGPLVRVLTRVAYRNAEDAEPKSWVLAAARIEGAVVVAGALVGLFRLANADGSKPNARDAGNYPTDSGS